jgi:hypothetical protein
VSAPLRIAIICVGIAIFAGLYGIGTLIKNEGDRQRDVCAAHGARLGMSAKRQSMGRGRYACLVQSGPGWVIVEMY